MNIFFYSTRQKGLSLVETVIGVALFAAVAMMLYTTYQRVLITARSAQARVDAIAVANAQFELIRNLPYSQIGTIAGIPSGTIAPVQTLVSGGKTFIATTTIRNIDLPFDGTAGGTPNDLSPADNKLVEIEISCISCQNFRPLRLTTNVAPQSLESASTNGSLFVQVIDAGGLPVSNANVHIFNASTTPVIDISDVTATSGMLQIIDAPPSVGSYQISVSKSGYSSEQTYGAPTTTNPVNPHATIAVQTVTLIALTIDRESILDVSSVSPSCAVVPNIDFQLIGNKLIDTAPVLNKYNNLWSTNASGQKTLTNIEWDIYSLVASSSSYDVAGVVPLSPISLSPGATQNVQIVLVPKNSPSALITVKDGATGLPITGATVILEKGGASTTQTTGRGYLRQTDWSGGSGQSLIGDLTQYASGDGGVETSATPGEVLLKDILGAYAGTGELTSSTFDTGAPANFYQFTFLPTSQPVDTGVNSARFQIATGNSTTSWTYLGPDGTSGTYYTATTTDISSVNNGNRYLRYKMFLSTASSTYTPDISDVQFTFTSACIPPGQVIFPGLSEDTYNLTVSASGYSDYIDTVVVSAGTQWQEKTVALTPP